MLAMPVELGRFRDQCHYGSWAGTLKNVQDAVSSVGYVSYYDGSKVEADGCRFRAEFEIVMPLRQDYRDAPHRVIFDVIRTYAQEYGGSPRIGAINVRVLWNLWGESQCIAAAGVGYHILETLNWGTVSQSELYNLLNHDNYADSEGSDIGSMAYYQSNIFCHSN